MFKLLLLLNCQKCLDEVDVDVDFSSSLSVSSDKNSLSLFVFRTGSKNLSNDELFLTGKIFSLEIMFFISNGMIFPLEKSSSAEENCWDKVVVTVNTKSEAVESRRRKSE